MICEGEELVEVCYASRMVKLLKACTSNKRNWWINCLTKRYKKSQLSHRLVCTICYLYLVLQFSINKTVECFSSLLQGDDLR